jgi:hypothetical protein
MNPLPSHLALLARLGDEARYRVAERAALIFYGSPPDRGMTWPKADELAYLQEAHAQRSLTGVT